MNVHIKSDDRRRQEAYVAERFGKSGELSSADRDAAAVIAARTCEIYSTLKKMEERKNG